MCTVVSVWLICATAQAAEEPDEIGATADESAGSGVEEVVVTGSRTLADSHVVPFAVTRIDAATIESAGPQINLSEALLRVPGIAANNRSNYAQDLQISARGYGARAGFGVRGLRLYSDNIPATAPDGQGQVAHFDLASAERIEVLRGPFSALYGNSSGGVIALFSRAPQQDDGCGTVDFGSFGLRKQRVSAEGRLTGMASVAAQLINVNVGGFRPHSSADRRLSTVRFGYEGGADHVVVGFSDLDQRADDPLGLTRAQFDADPRQTAPQAKQFDTRKTVRQTQAGANWEHGLGDDGLRALVFTPYVGQRSVTQWQAIPVATQNSPSHSGGVVDFDRSYYGADLRLQMQQGAFSLIAGFAYEAQDEDRRGYENFVGTTLGVTGALRRKERNRVHSIDQYLQGEWRIAPRWRASLGLRHGQTHFDSDDRYLDNGDDSGSTDYAFWTPATGLVYEANAAWSLYASAARGYETPSFTELAYRADGSQGLNTTLDAQTSQQLEWGAKLRRPTLKLDADVFVADTHRELIAVSNAGGRSAYANAGNTRRYGAELWVDWQLHADWHTLAAMTWIDARYRDSFYTCASASCATPGLLVPDGKRIPGIARSTAYAELEWSPRSSLGFALEGRALSRVAVNDINSDAAGTYATLALRAQYRVERGVWSLRTLARLDNLLNRQYAGSVIVNESNQRFFEPGAPRNWLLGASVRCRF